MSINHKNIESYLFNQIEKTDQPDIAYIEQYKNFLLSIDKVAERRQAANSYFLAVNTGVCAILGYILSKDAAKQVELFYLVIPIAGILLSYFWHCLVKSYRQLNEAKFEVLYMIEKKLPLSPFKAEWIALGEGNEKKKYTTITKLEIWIPRLLISMYAILFCRFWIRGPGYYVYVTCNRYHYRISFHRMYNNCYIDCIKSLKRCNNSYKVVIMARYIKNPIPVEADEYKYGLEDGFDDIDDAVKAGFDIRNYTSVDDSKKVPYIKTLEGKHYINNGDYIITGIEGERYPCKRSIFLKTYSLYKN